MLLAFKLIGTPILIAMVSLAGRRWGSGVSGWLVGLPLTSGPISLFLALQYGAPFAAQAAVGTLGGTASVGCFCLVYCLVARKANWVASVGSGAVAFLLSTYLLNHLALSLLPTFFGVIAFLALILAIIPAEEIAIAHDQMPKWDLPGRMLAATLFILLITTFASVLGPQLSGLLTPFPIFSTILAVFNHRLHGAQAGIQFLRGVVAGLLAFSCFFLFVGSALTGLGILWAYLAATLVALVINSLSLRLVHPKAAGD